MAGAPCGGEGGALPRRVGGRGATAIGTTSEGERERGEGNTERVEMERERRTVDILVHAQ